MYLICHGFHNSDGYGILMHSRFSHDYAQAVSESIAYWTRPGKLRNVGNFDYVFMSTCYSGYAPGSVTTPTYDIPLAQATDYKTLG